MSTMRYPRLVLALWLCFMTCMLCDAPSAAAFCGFFVSAADGALHNDASHVVLMRSGNRTVMTMSNNYQGPPQDFAMVVPVPVVLQKEQVKTLDPQLLRRVEQLSAPRLVEYWERNPCAPRDEDGIIGLGSLGTIGRGGGTGSGYGAGHGVTIEARFAVGEYEILILSAQESGGLETWLREHHYRIPAGAAEALAPYIRDQMKFFVAKVDSKRVKRDERGAVVLSPLRFSYEAQELRLPVRLGLLNASGKQDLLVYVLSPSKRFEVANYPNVFIPSNIEVADAVRHAFPAFYAELFDGVLAQKGGKAVVTEYAWDTRSCDPCPTPPLKEADLLTLGADSLGGPAGRRSFVLTRLHTRYDREALSEDLIFREAQPVLGGRARWDGTVGDQGAQVSAGGVNQFQGRYIIRHYWEQKVTCKAPLYGVWGGPPGSPSYGLSGSPGSKAIAATGLSAAPRGKLKLAKVVRTAIPELGLPGVPAPVRRSAP